MESGGPILLSAGAVAAAHQSLPHTEITHCLAWRSWGVAGSQNTPLRTNFHPMTVAWKGEVSSSLTAPRCPVPLRRFLTRSFHLYPPCQAASRQEEQKGSRIDQWHSGISADDTSVDFMIYVSSSSLHWQAHRSKQRALARAQTSFLLLKCSSSLVLV